MATTYIDTDQCPRLKLAGAQGAVAKIVNRDLCGAKNVVGMLRWLKEGERFDADSLILFRIPGAQSLQDDHLRRHRR